ncbi:MAG: peptidylprolyl isomerase, partial [Proteiniphilum sp.]|nr:peptidylprolyl isomerase [Proteiniphilum sp.]
KVLDLPKSIFEIDGKIDENVLFEGNTVPMMDASGNHLMGSVVAVGDETVTMDFNHPLAGELMHFEGRVTGVRDASAEEIAVLLSGDGCGCGSGGCGCGDGENEDGSCGCGSGGGGCGSGCNC